LSLLDEMAPERIGVIVGTGNMTEMLPQLGYDFRGAYKKVREAIKIMRSAFQSADLDFKGEYFKASGGRLAMPSKHRIPIYVAANGPKMLEVGGELADGVITQYADRQLMEKALSHVKIGAEKARRNIDEVEVIWEGALVVGETSERLQGTLMTHAANCVLFCPRDWVALKGITDDDYERVKRGYVMGSHLDLGLEKQYAAQLTRDPKAKVIQSMFTIAGSPSSCGERIRELSALGVRGIFAWIASANEVEKRGILEGIASNLIPQFS
jgi:5,10-methylenetetrahydromethanopterin reductase